MTSPKRSPLLVRAATLSLALAALTGLVVHASLSAGCGTPSSGSPVASAEAPPIIPTSASASAPTLARDAPAPVPSPASSSSARAPAFAAPAPAGIHRRDLAFPATKAAQVFFPDEEQPAPAGSGSARGR